MSVVFSTDKCDPRHALSYWRDTVCATFAEIDCAPLSDTPFRASLVDMEVSGIHFCEVDATPVDVTKTESLVRKATHDNFMLCVQQSGTCVMTQNGHHVRLVPGDLALLDSASPYQLRFPTSFRQLVVHMPRAELLAIAPIAQARCGQRVPGATASVPIVSRFLTQMAGYARQKEPQGSDAGDQALKRAALSMIESALHVKWRALTDLSSRYVLWHTATELIAREARNSALTTARIAEALGVSERRLQQVFQHHGDSVSRHLWRVRLERCKSALDAASDGRRSIGDIALAGGFNSFSHFSRSFRNAYGCTPREYRESSRHAGTGSKLD